MRIVTAVRYDVLFQFRHGFYYAYLFVTGIYLLILLNLKGDVRQTLTVALLFADTVMIGFFFIGAIVLLEKAQNTLESLFVTPLRLGEYLLAKAASLTLIASASGFIIMTAANGMVRHPVIFAAGLMLSSFCYTLLGLVFAARARHVNDYFARSLACSMLLSLPVLGHVHVVQSPLFSLFPTNATLVLFKAPFYPTSAAETALSFLCLIVWSVIFGLLARARFLKHVVMKTGAGR